MRPIGFSTGSIAPGDIPEAVRILRAFQVRVVELSTLRLNELPVLIDISAGLELAGFSHVSVHAPSRFPDREESRVVDLLHNLRDFGWAIVVHPDVIRTDQLWREFGGLLWIENMDKRKPLGRTADELTLLFERFPEAGLCLDVAHARQCDPTMVEMSRILAVHGNRLKQVHLSEVGTSSTHVPLSFGAILDFARFAETIPEDTPIILESPVDEISLGVEIERASLALPEPAVART